MKSRKHRKLKRHPIVRFIRGVFRLFRVLFGSKRRMPTLDLHIPTLDLEIPAAIKESNFDRDQLITVGELLGRVKWQSPSPNIQKEATSTARSQNAARN